MSAVLSMDFSEQIAQKKCGNCGSTDRVKTVQVVRKGGKRKITVQKKLCFACRQKHS